MTENPAGETTVDEVEPETSARAFQRGAMKLYTTVWAAWDRPSSEQ